MSIFILLLIHVAFVKFDKSSEVLYQKIVAAIYISSTYPQRKTQAQRYTSQKQSKTQARQGERGFPAGSVLKRT